jgi:hypothetical protein
MPSKHETMLMGLTPGETEELAREALDILENDKAVQVCVQWAVDHKMTEEMIGELEDADTDPGDVGEDEDEPDPDDPL